MPVNLKIWPHKLLLISTIAFMILLGISMILPMKLQTVKNFCRVIMRYHTLCVWFTQFCYPYKGGQRLIDKRGGMVKGRWRGHEAIAAKTSWLSWPKYRWCMPRGHHQSIAPLLSLSSRGLWSCRTHRITWQLHRVWMESEYKYFYLKPVWSVSWGVYAPQTQLEL